VLAAAVGTPVEKLLQRLPELSVSSLPPDLRSVERMIMHYR
jgi:hypothetical protein